MKLDVIKSLALIGAALLLVVDFIGYLLKCLLRRGMAGRAEQEKAARGT